MFQKFLVLAVLALMVTGCQTTSGIGKDVRDAGEWIDKKASGE